MGVHMIVQFTIDGHPVPKGRPRFGRSRGGFTVAYTPQATTNYEAWVKHCAVAAMAGQPPLEGPLMLRATFYLEIPQSWPAWKHDAAAMGQVYPTGKPDTDNFIKAVTDGANGILWRDDSQLVLIEASKAYASDGKPGSFVWVKRLEAIASAAEWKARKVA